MLVLSRKCGQTIQIGDQITIKVTKLSGNQVRIGIVAPRETPIRRGELKLNGDLVLCDDMDPGDGAIDCAALRSRVA